MMAANRPSEPIPEPVEPTTTATPTTPTAVADNSIKPTGLMLGLDWVMAGGALALAFFAGSFAAQNSDVWMRLATGRLLADGGYSFGTDPFSYSSEGRTWVNHSWLVDLLSYKLFQVGGGAALIIGKCVLLAIAAGFVLLARRPGQSAVPFTVCCVAGVLAAAPRLLLQPTIVSLVFLTALLCALIRLPKPAGSWRFPVGVAILFCLWANCDQWFILGPAILLLYAIGQYIRPDPETDVLSVWKALGLGVLACMLSPHHYHVWTIPPEVFGGDLARIFQGDPEFDDLFRPGLDKERFRFSHGPANPGGLIAILALTVIGIAVNYRQMSIGLTLVQFGAIALWGIHYRAVPLMALIIAPIAAKNLAEAISRLGTANLAIGTAKLIQTGQSTGRMIGVLGLTLLITVSYAGWLHPYNLQRRWAWDLAPNDSNRRAAEQIKTWREAGLLPEGARVLNIQPDMGAYLAWHAPGEKAFFDNRLALHRGNAEQYAAVRRAFSIRSEEERRQDPFDLDAFLRDREISYAVTAHPDRRRNQQILRVMWRRGPDAEWPLWHVAGRAVIVGWGKQTSIPKAKFNALRFDPIRIAFGPTEPLPAPQVRPPVPTADVWDKFLAPPPTTSPDAEEALVIREYADMRIQLLAVKQQASLAACFRSIGELYKRFHELPAFTRFIGTAKSVPLEMPTEVYAASLLSVRAARRAAANSPDHPDAHLMLASMYEDDAFQTFPDLKIIVSTVAYSRYMARMPADPAGRGMQDDLENAAMKLYSAHRGSATPPRFDLAHDVIKVSAAYLRQNIADLEAILPRLPEEQQKQLEKDIAGRTRALEERNKEIEKQTNDLKKMNDRYVNAVASIVSPIERSAVARRFGLVKEAIAELTKAQQQYQKQLEGDGANKQMSPEETASLLAVHAELVELLMYAGQAEEAARILQTIDGGGENDVPVNDRVRVEYAKIRSKAAARLIPESPPRSPYDADPAAHFRVIRMTLSLALGQFDSVIRAQLRDAKEARRALDEFVQKNYPKGAPVLTREMIYENPEASQARFLPLITLRPVDGVEMLAKAQVGRTLRNYWALLVARSDVHARLALTHLEVGNLQPGPNGADSDAVYHLKQTLDGPELPAKTDAQRIASSYLKALGVPTK